MRASASASAPLPPLPPSLTSTRHLVPCIININARHPAYTLSASTSLFPFVARGKSSSSRSPPSTFFSFFPADTWVFPSILFFSTSGRLSFCFPLVPRRRRPQGFPPPVKPLAHFAHPPLPPVRLTQRRLPQQQQHHHHPLFSFPKRDWQRTSPTWTSGTSIILQLIG